MQTKVSSFLVIEDNELDFEKISRGIRQLGSGCSIVHAENGYDALEVLRGEREAVRLHVPYIIILDLNMPKMNGLEFLSALRADPALAHAPVFVLTTSDRPADIEAAHAWNVCGYIVKPIKLDQMADTLGALNEYLNVCELPKGTSVRG